MNIAFATNNPHKVIEVSHILRDVPIALQDMKQLGLNEDIIEDQDTFEGNALKKARWVCAHTGMPTIADDSGVCIDALDGAPGIYSARWAGEQATGADITRHTLNAIRQVPLGKRTANFVSCAVLVVPEGKEWVEFGRVFGSLTTEPKGEMREKFPYDVIFIPDEGDGRTFAQMTVEEKNNIQYCHRTKSFTALKPYILEAVKSQTT